VLKHTGPIKSGIQIAQKATFIKMQQKPSRVTMLGAIHSGRRLTEAFHYMTTKARVSYRELQKVGNQRRIALQPTNFWSDKTGKDDKTRGR
jgi:hypothetical protein